MLNHHLSLQQTRLDLGSHGGVYSNRNASYEGTRQGLTFDRLTALRDARVRDYSIAPGQLISTLVPRTEMRSNQKKLNLAPRSTVAPSTRLERLQS